jgi:hypothetical protein
MTSPPSKKLRFVTYLSPGIPVGLFETIMYYLEEVTGRHAYLIHESRWSGPPPGRDDPLTLDEVDVSRYLTSDPWVGI